MFQSTSTCMDMPMHVYMCIHVVSSLATTWRCVLLGVPLHERAARGVVICAVEPPLHSQCALTIAQARAFVVCPAARCGRRESLLKTSFVVTCVTKLAHPTMARAEVLTQIGDQLFITSPITALKKGRRNEFRKTSKDFGACSPRGAQK